MPIRASSIRLFVSSTFSDFHREREILQHDVFPHIERLCRERGVQFQPVDLRWGIGPDAVRAQKTLTVCLQEVKRCTQTSLRPCFLVLMGDRYGWQPLPTLIERREFDRLLDYVRSHEGLEEAIAAGTADALSVWYRLDLNQVPAHFVLQPREDADGLDWDPIERRLRSALRAAATGLRLPAAQREKYFLSATAHEILQGVLRSATDRPDDAQHTLCFVRRRLGVPPSLGAEPHPDFVDQGSDGRRDPEAAQLLARLRRRVARALGDNVLVYHAFVGATEESAGYERAFGADARTLLTALVNREMNRLSPYRSEELESMRHQEFAWEQGERVFGRRALIGRLDRFLDRRDARAMLLFGGGGMGKTTLVAKAAAMATDRGLVVIQRYIGTTGPSSTGVGLVKGLLRELSAITGLPEQPASRSSDWSVLGEELRRLLEEIGRRSAHGVLLAVDGMDQLDSSDPARRFEWLPMPPPENAALLVSVVESDLRHLLQTRLGSAELLEIGGISALDGRAALRSLLREDDRRLQPAQEAHILDHFKHERAPLYIRLAAELTKTWPAYAGQTPSVADLPASTVSLIESFFASLASESRHGTRLVDATLGLLCASRHGLSEHELIATLSRQPALMQQVRATAAHAAPLRTLPFIFWSRLRDELGPFLTERVADETPVLALFHRLFDEAARRRSFQGRRRQVQLHKSLADYFEGLPTWIRSPGSQDRPNIRKLAELPYQLIRAGDAQRMQALLADMEYCRAKLHAGAEHDLYAEFQACDALARGESLVPARRRTVNALANLVVRIVELPEAYPEFDIEQLHASMAHRRSTSFYRDFLRRCNARLRSLKASAASRKLALALQSRAANLLRRDGQLAHAARQLKALQSQARRWSTRVELSRIEYDLGYVHFLRGNLEQAVRAFEQSARTARAGGNEVSRWISACLAANVRWLQGVSQGDAQLGSASFLQTLHRAERVFRQQAERNAVAVRWLYNVNAHRFSIAFRTGDKELATRALNALREDAWLKERPDREPEVQVLHSRMAILEGRIHEGAAKLADQTARRLKSTPNREALAEDLFDVGNAYQAAGRVRAAHAAWRKAEGLPADAGNRLWQRLCRRALASGGSRQFS